LYLASIFENSTGKIVQPSTFFDQPFDLIVDKLQCRTNLSRAFINLKVSPLTNLYFGSVAVRRTPVTGKFYQPLVLNALSKRQQIAMRYLYHNPVFAS